MKLRAQRERWIPVCTAFVVVVHLAIGYKAGGPVAVPDIPAYLSITHWVWGGDLVENLAFHPGYGLLLSPFGGLSGESLHHAALLLNSLLAGASILLAAQLAKELNVSKGTRFIVIIMTIVYPGLAAASRIAWPETLLFVIILALVLLILRNNFLCWSLASFLTALAICVHPRAIVLTATFAVVATLTRNSKAMLTGIIPGLIFTASALSATNTWPMSRISGTSGFGDHIDLAASTMGQVLALSAGTLSLGLVGLVLGLKELWVLRTARAEKIAFCFVATSALAMIVLGGWSLAGSDRGDTLMYSRYVDPWAIPLTIFALAAFNRKKITKWCAIYASLLVGASLFFVLVAADGASMPGRRIMVLPLGAIWQMFDGKVVATACTAALITCVGLAASKFSFYLPGLLLIILASVSTISNNHHLEVVGQVSEGQSSVFELVPKSERCLSHDLESTKPYAIWLYRLQMPETKHQLVSLSSSESLCGNYVIAGLDVLTECGGAHFISKEPRAAWGLWAYPARGCG
jgi:hypothetical protein